MTVPSTDAPPADTGAPVRYVLEIFQPDGTRGEINRELLLWLDAKMKACAIGRRSIEVDLWLDSLGGDAHAAFRIALLLHEKVSRLRVVIPDSARSAATLLALSADEIYMADAAEFGPLDAQIKHAGEVASARDMVRNLEYLQRQAYGFSGEAAKGYQHMFELPPVEALRAGVDLAVALQQPLMNRIEVLQILEAKNLLEATERYANRLISLPYRRRLLRGEDTTPPPYERLAQTVRKLVRDYPTHDFVIDRVEAEGLRLPVSRLGNYEEAQQTVTALEEVRKSRQAWRDFRLVTPSPHGKDGDESRGSGRAGDDGGGSSSGSDSPPWQPPVGTDSTIPRQSPDSGLRDASPHLGDHVKNAGVVDVRNTTRREFRMRHLARQGPSLELDLRDQFLSFVPELTFSPAHEAEKELGEPWMWVHNNQD